jgi:hypothetical protein
MVLSDTSERPDEVNLAFMMSMIKSIKPRDSVEARPVAQMVSVHVMAMRCAHHLASAQDAPPYGTGEFGTGLRSTRLDETGLVSRTRCSVLHAAPQSRDPLPGSLHPGSAAHHAARHRASKTRVNALMALRCVQGTKAVRAAFFLPIRTLQLI